MRTGSLFSGYMGLDMAVEAVTGAKTAWVSDIDKGACKILTHRAADVPNLGDITAIDWSTVEPVDILTGGFPCQDLSHAGKRAGLKEGTRSGLWSHMARAIDELRPRLVVAENVRGLLSAEAPGDVEPCPWCVGDAPTVDLRALGVVLADLADIGYDTQWVGLRAADVGACHGRFRIFLIAHPQDTGGMGWAVGRLSAPVQGSGRRTRDRAAGPSGVGDDGQGLPTLPSSGVVLLPTPAVNDMGAGKTVEDWDAWTDAMKAKHGNGNGHGPSLAIEAQRLLPTPDASPEKYRLGGDSQQSRSLPAMAIRGELDLLQTPKAHDGAFALPRTSGRPPEKSTHLATDVEYNITRTGTTFGDYAPAIARWENVIGRPAPDPTEPTGKNGAHRLAPRFVEFMMGLPEGWVTDVPDLTRNEALKALGNGVVPQQAEAALRHMFARQAVAA